MNNCSQLFLFTVLYSFLSSVFCFVHVHIAFSVSDPGTNHILSVNSNIKHILSIPSYSNACHSSVISKIVSPNQERIFFDAFIFNQRLTNSSSSGINNSPFWFEIFVYRFIVVNHITPIFREQIWSPSSRFSEFLCDLFASLIHITPIQFRRPNFKPLSIISCKKRGTLPHHFFSKTTTVF